MEPVKEFGEKLRNLRRSRGMSQESLAQLLGVNRKTVTFWERGLSPMSVAYLYRVAQVFKVSLREFDLGR